MPPTTVARSDETHGDALVLHLPRSWCQPDPEPVRANSLQGERVVRTRHAQRDRPVALQPAGLVAVDARGEPRRPVPHLPHQRGVGRIDPETVDAGLDVEPQHVPGQRTGEPEVEGIAGFRARREQRDSVFGDAKVLPCVRPRAIGARGEGGDDRRRFEHEVVDGGEDDGVPPRRGHLGAGRDHDRVVQRRARQEREVGTGGTRWERLHAHEVEHLRVEASGTWLSRYSTISLIQANSSMRATPGSDG